VLGIFFLISLGRIEAAISTIWTIFLRIWPGYCTRKSITSGFFGHNDTSVRRFDVAWNSYYYLRLGTFLFLRTL